MSVPARIVDAAEVLAGPRSGTLDVAQGPFRDNLVFSAELAHIVATTSFVPEALRGNEAEIVGALMHGFELGLTPMQSLRSIAPIDGKPAISAEAMRALVVSRGHDLWLEETSATRAIACGRRRGQEHVAKITWTLDDAARAGIAGKPNWRRYPADMLRARATAALCRLHFPDVTLGLLTVEELEDEAGAPGMVTGEASLGAPAAAPTPRRRRRTTQPLASVPTPPPAPVIVPAGPLLPGEQPAAPAQPDAVSQAQQRKLHALLREHDLGEREAGLAFISSVLGHELASSADLTSEQASRIIDVLTAMPARETEPTPRRTRRAKTAGDADAATATAPPVASPAPDSAGGAASADPPAPPAGELEPVGPIAQQLAAHIELRMRIAAAIDELSDRDLNRFRDALRRRSIPFQVQTLQERFGEDALDPITLTQKLAKADEFRDDVIQPATPPLPLSSDEEDA